MRVLYIIPLLVVAVLGAPSGSGISAIVNDLNAIDKVIQADDGQALPDLVNGLNALVSGIQGPIQGLGAQQNSQGVQEFINAVNALNAKLSQKSGPLSVQIKQLLDDLASFAQSASISELFNGINTLTSQLNTIMGSLSGKTGKNANGSYSVSYESSGNNAPSQQATQHQKDIQINLDALVEIIGSGKGGSLSSIINSVSTLVSGLNRPLQTIGTKGQSGLKDFIAQVQPLSDKFGQNSDPMSIQIKKLLDSLLLLSNDASAGNGGVRFPDFVTGLNVVTKGLNKIIEGLNGKTSQNANGGWTITLSPGSGPTEKGKKSQQEIIAILTFLREAVLSDSGIPLNDIVSALNGLTSILQPAIQIVGAQANKGMPDFVKALQTGVSQFEPKTDEVSIQITRLIKLLITLGQNVTTGRDGVTISDVVDSLNTITTELNKITAAFQVKISQPQKPSEKATENVKTIQSILVLLTQTITSITGAQLPDAVDKLNQFVAGLQGGITVIRQQNQQGLPKFVDTLKLFFCNSSPIQIHYLRNLLRLFVYSYKLLKMHKPKIVELDSLISWIVSMQ